MVQHVVISGTNLCQHLQQTGTQLRSLPVFPVSQGAAKRPAPSRRQQQQLCTCQAASEEQPLDRRALLGAGVALTAAGQLSLPRSAPAQNVYKDWERVNLDVDPNIVLLDVGFEESDPNHGFLLGSRQTLLETKDAGRTWSPRSIAAAKEEGFNYRFTSISFSGAEGWIVGKPAILLHTTDGGSNWERVPLSAKLPGNPILVKAIEGKSGQAEMTTDQGAVYVTDNAAYTWTAAVQETVDATLNRTVSSGISGASYYEGSFSNINRSPDGEYVAVSSRGNFYLTWSPGQTFWQPHNRPSARRVQNMGWTPTNRLWLATRGGDVYFGSDKGSTGNFDQVKLGSRGFGILDVGFLDKTLGFACGGSGTLFRTEDGGKAWKRDRSADDIAGNLYSIKFFPQNKSGFILGNAGILLRFLA
ncbi:hypothetical protein WJX73_002456 [Symbiochloris irregularis]|uniref:Photosynthesis system II assembly factor Ycf48/Hcf136-like domain-containing protein n=1 Tax=Symbiochloris irregularis TaxID=706552 RepID=A0AAW1NP43_9CHLO